ncbi:hypothetical protein, partial [Pseudomonas aeruginosa]
TCIAIRASYALPYTLYIPGVFPAPDTLFPHTGLSGALFELSGHEGHDVHRHLTLRVHLVFLVS